MFNQSVFQSVYFSSVLLYVHRNRRLIKDGSPGRTTFWSRPVMAITASVQPEMGRIAYAGSDLPHPFRLRFSNEGMDYIAQNRPGSDLDGLVSVWPNGSGPEASSCAGITGPSLWQNATGPLPVSYFQTRFRSSTDVLDNTVQN